MRIGALRTLLVSAGALLVLSALPCVCAGAAGSVSPLPASDYTVKPICGPPSPGHAGCLSLELVPRTAAARSHTHPLGITRSRPIEAASPPEGAFGLRPQDLHSAYQLPTTAPSSQTIAIVDAYDDLTAEADLNVYDKTFGLPACTEANGCFRKVNEKGGKTPLPSSIGEEAEGWAEEISLDIEVSHAVCQSNCQIVLVEADSSSGNDLEVAEETAAGLGATEISNSWGGPELPGPPANDTGGVFDRSGVVITASSGDDGYLNWDSEAGPEAAFADYPASSPHVVAVGGTRLSLSGSDEWAGETVWNGNGADGGGCSVRFTAPPWQQSVSDWSSVGCGEQRAVADVSADADPYTGLAVYDSAFECEYEENGVSHMVHWCTIGGTSLASPLIAATFALAGGAGRNASGETVEYPAQTLYENLAVTPSSLHDVTQGSSGECANPFDTEEGPLLGTSGCETSAEATQCSEQAICLARPGYDGPTGVGTPNGIAAFQHNGQQAGGGEEVALKGESESERSASAGGGPESGGGGDSASNGPSTGTGASGAGGAAGGKAGGSTSASGKAIIKLSAFALTPSALLALNHARPKVSEVGFAFTLSTVAHVRATLFKRVRVRGRGRWKLLPGALTFTAIKGRNRRSFTNHGTLAPGRYRLTLTPQHGSARSIDFRVASRAAGARPSLVL